MIRLCDFLDWGLSVDWAAAVVAVVLHEPAVRAPWVLVPLLVVASDSLEASR